MRFALSHEKERIETTPGGSGVCPGCNAEMLARCGTKRFGIGRIRADATVTLGGKTRLSGTEAGKADFRFTGKRCRLVMERVSCT